MGNRYRLKKREVREILEKASLTIGNIDLNHFITGMEATKIDSQKEIFYINGRPVFINVNGKIFPTLLNKEILDNLPTLTVDMGAIPHLCNGADLMAPGIVKVSGKFKFGAMAVIVDEKFSKHIALVKTMCDSDQLTKKKQGKVGQNIHYVGDKFWKIFKVEKHI